MSGWHEESCTYWDDGPCDCPLQGRATNEIFGKRGDPYRRPRT